MKWLAVALAVFTTPVVAGEQEVAMIGVGTSTCAQFAQLYRTDPARTDEIFLQWAHGFLSGMNAGFLTQGKQTFNILSVSISDQQFFFRQYCDQHPLENFASAVLDLQQHHLKLN